MSSRNGRKPKIAVFKFASCDGCQLSLLDAEDELLAVVSAVEIAYFPEASRRMLKGPYDIGLVEGSITTHHDAERIQQVRRQCRTLVTIGACATAGGIQALRNWKDVNEFVRYVYASPDYISTLKMSTPIAEHVPVDFELRGCPINKYHLVELIAATLAGRKPNIPTYSVCLECKRRGERVHHGGPGSRPAWGRSRKPAAGPCVPVTLAAAMAASARWRAPTPRRSASSCTCSGQSDQAITRAFRSFNAWSWQFRQAERGEGTVMSAPRKPATSIKVDVLARVEGEGALHIKLKGDRVQDVKLKIFEPPRLLRGLPPGTALLGSARHHRPHLRHLPHRLPDERRARDRAGAGDYDRSRGSGCCGGCSIAANGSRATRSTSTCCTRRISWATRTSSRWPRITGRRSSQALRLKKIGNALVSLMGGREIHPISAAVGGFHKVPSKKRACLAWWRT